MTGPMLGYNTSLDTSLGRMLLRLRPRRLALLLFLSAQLRSDRKRYHLCQKFCLSLMFETVELYRKRKAMLL